MGNSVKTLLMDQRSKSPSNIAGQQKKETPNIRAVIYLVNGKITVTHMEHLDLSLLSIETRSLAFIYCNGL